jgi:hypothetical protein
MLENLIFYQSFRLSELAVSNSECSQTKAPNNTIFKDLIRIENVYPLNNNLLRQL